MRRVIILAGLILLITFANCTKNKDVIQYHPFNGLVWQRFDIIKFKIPLKRNETLFDLSLFARFTRSFEYENLDFNMIMTTLSGEERIKEYHLNAKKKSGEFYGEWKNDTCEISIPLKTELKLADDVLMIQIENLIPRLETGSIAGVGIRLHPIR